MPLNTYQLEHSSVGRLLFRYSVPPFFVSVLTAVYLIIDSIFISMMNENALTAFSAAGPFVSLKLILPVGISIGAGSLTARMYGVSPTEKVSKVTAHGFMLAGAGWAFIVLPMVFITPLLLRFFTEDAAILGYGTTYLRLTFLLSLPIFIGLTAERLLIVAGEMRTVMFCRIISLLLNLVLDPFLIFGLFGFPRLGIAGAAIAAASGEMILTLLSLWKLRKCAPEFLTFKGFRFDKEVIGQIFFVAVPAMIRIFTCYLFMILYNLILSKMSDSAMVIMGYFYKWTSFAQCFLPGNGLIPVIGYNYGSGFTDRYRKAVKISLIYTITVMSALTVIFFFVTPLLMRLFTNSPSTIQDGIMGLFLCSLYWLPMGITNTLTIIFETSGDGFFGMTVILSQAVFTIIGGLICMTYGLFFVFLSFSLAQYITLIIAFIYIKSRRSY